MGKIQHGGFLIEDFECEPNWIRTYQDIMLKSHKIENIKASKSLFLIFSHCCTVLLAPESKYKHEIRGDIIFCIVFISF